MNGGANGSDIPYNVSIMMIRRFQQPHPIEPHVQLFAGVASLPVNTTVMATVHPTAGSGHA